MTKKQNDVNQDREKLEIIKWVAALRDRAMIEMLKMLKDNPKKIDWWNGVSEEEKKAIELRNSEFKM